MVIVSPGVGSGSGSGSGSGVGFSQATNDSIDTISAAIIQVSFLIVLVNLLWFNMLLSANYQHIINVCRVATHTLLITKHFPTYKSTSFMFLRKIFCPIFYKKIDDTSQKK
jgi:hypothetical protein